MLKQLKKRDEGFTIIEVLIVLAIAGLIMLIVFLAVPALQRNSRNTSRRSDVSHLGGLINEYVANNNGSTPAHISTGTGNTAGTLYLNTESFAVMSSTISDPTTVPASLPSTIDTFYVYTSATCNGNTPTSGASSRSVVIYFMVESSNGNVGQCTQV